MADSEIVRLCRLLGAQVRRLRKDRGWTQADLAAKVNLSLDMMGRIERGSAAPSLKTIARIAQKLDAPVAALFGGSVGKARSGDRSRRMENIVAILSALDLSQLDRVHRVIIAAVKN